MNKINYAKTKKEENGIEEFRPMYECIREALAQGVPVGWDLDEALSCMTQNENGVDTLIDYKVVDRYFDARYSETTAKRIAIKAAQKYADRFISKKIAQDYLTDKLPEKERKRVRSTDIYAWETTEMDKCLGTIFFYARQRRMVKQLSHYVDRGPKLINKVKERLKADLKNLRGNLSRYHDEMPSASIGRFTFLEKANERYDRLDAEYPSSHQDYIDKYKGYKKELVLKDRD